MYVHVTILQAAWGELDRNRSWVSCIPNVNSGTPFLVMCLYTVYVVTAVSLRELISSEITTQVSSLRELIKDVLEVVSN